MGSLNSTNPVHYDNGWAYRDLVKPLYAKLQLIAPHVGIGTKQAIIAHDVLLAKIAALAVVNLSMSGSNSDEAKDFAKQAINERFFYHRFNLEMEVMECKI